MRSTTVRPVCLVAACAGLAALVTASAARGQPGPAEQAPKDAAGKAPPQLVLGARVEALRRGLKTVSSVVIVSNTADYARAVASWTLDRRFPVLIDDGSAAARENIARFVRGFAPASVVRWSAAEDGLPQEPAAFQGAIESAARRAWGANDQPELDEIWKRSQFAPFGVVVASPADPAWTAALALAAGRGQPILWIDSAPARLGDTLDDAAFESLDRRIRSGLSDLGMPFASQGDQIESVTLCLSVGTRVNRRGEMLALTDLLCRDASGTRFAWTGVLPGDSSTAAYRAMSALFLQPRRAWLFDGYKEGFAAPYQLPPAAKAFNEGGFEVSANTPPLGGAEHWRDRSRWAVSHEFIHVNSSGNSTFFELSPGRAFAGDVPMLERPACVHFIHSFSAQQPHDANTVAGRWLAHGAYAYYGSMDEPFLGAFLPINVVAQRWLGGAPLVCAVRAEQERPWKLNYFGDPLITLGPIGARDESPVGLDGTRDVTDEMKAALREKKLAEGVAMLVMLGRDADAVKVARASAADAALDERDRAAIAATALTAAYREKERELFLQLFEQLPAEAQREPMTADLLWLIAREDLDTTRDERLLGRLRATIRQPSVLEDAAALAPALKRVFGVEAARSMYGTLLQRTTDENVKKWLREAAAKY